MAVPVLSSVAQCVRFYSDCLTTRQRCGLRLRKGSLWRVGSACSGTDYVIRVLEHLGRSSGWVFKHTFSCECDGSKQAWLQEKFAEVPLILEDIYELHTGRALNIITGEESNVQDVDLSVAWQDR